MIARDPRADGGFVYAVRTTGVYCRPSCPARQPRPQNVQIFADCVAAERAGYRACKRCQPNAPAVVDRRATMVAALCRVIEASEEPPSLAVLAAHAGKSPVHVHRVFKAVTGLTPRAYAAAHRAGRVRAALTERATITEAILCAGYGSSSRFYAQTGDVLGMTPTQYRAGGEGMEIQFTVARCSLGSLLVAATVRGVCAMLLGDEPRQLIGDLEQRFDRATLRRSDASLGALVAAAVRMVDEPRAGVELPLDVQGTAFQRRVWQALREIPVGSTTSYAELASRIGQPRAVRAVAQACAANPVAVAIPCHRVVRSDGDPSGYRWGATRKRALLAKESRG